MSDRLTILQGDCLEQMRSLPDACVQCCVTSPPYWRLRDYGVAGQIGLEPTPQEYVAKLVEVFTEVRRALREDGTAWVNLGDSYATMPYSDSHTFDPKYGGRNRKNGYPDRKPQPCLKHKDLCGIPWRVAFALQQPHYNGRIKDERDRIWLAAMIEAEGCLFIHRRGEGLSNGQGYSRKSATFGAGLEVASTDRVIAERCMQITGLGSICQQTPAQAKRRKLTIYRWSLRSNVCRDVIREVYPHMVAKQHEARLLIGCPSSGEAAEKAWIALKAIHQGATASEIDFKAPDSLFTPGWYLRSDVIWAKPNPMPESVTDRPTKSHEYIFLLTKSERYAYDAEAIREENSLTSAGDRLAFRGAGVYTNNQSKDNSSTVPVSVVPGMANEWNGRNKRTVWTVPTAPYSEAHFATFPPDLIKPCILAGCPVGGTVLDPFGGSGTTGMVALELGRKAILIELNPEYVKLQRQRCDVTPGLPFI